MSAESNLISMSQVTKKFGNVTALDAFDLDVRHGEVMGFLGPNGAGKSTAIRVLLGLLRPTGGTTQVFGLDPWRDAVTIHRRLAYVPGDVTLWPGLSGGTCIDILTAPYGHNNQARRDDLLERFDLDPTKKARTYSKGNRQKVSLVAALTVDTDVLILDEPTSGLDPLMEATFQECVRERAAQGTTVLLSSHILAEVEALADRITVIKSGSRVTCATLEELRHQARTHVHAVTERAPTLATGVVHDLQLQQTTSGTTELRCTVDNAHLAELVGAVHAAGVDTLTVAPPTLDELFMDVYAQPTESANPRPDGAESPPKALPNNGTTKSSDAEPGQAGTQHTGSGRPDGGDSDSDGSDYPDSSGTGSAHDSSAHTDSGKESR